MKPFACILGLLSAASLFLSWATHAQELVSPLTFSAPQRAYEGSRLDTTTLLAVSDGSLVVGGPTGDGKPQVLFFFATYCEHCEQTVEAINATYAKLIGGSERPVVGVSISPIDTTKDFAARTGASFPIGVAQQGAGILNEIGVSAVPAVVIIRGDGDVVFSHVGLMSGPDVVSTLEHAYKEIPKPADPINGKASGPDSKE